MARFVRSILAANAAIAADGDEVIDLPVNPLSAILIHISPLNETSTIGNFSMLAALLDALTSCRITHRGAAVIDANGLDLAALHLLYNRGTLWQSNAVETDNDRRSLVLPILFGRRAFMPGECFPETRRGEFQMVLNWDIADTGYDGLRRSIETIELLDATPEFVQKVTTLSQTFAATGDNDVDLPIGNAIRAVLAFGTTGYAGAAPAPTLGSLEVLKDNVQHGFTSTDFEVLRGTLGTTGITYPPDLRHIHSVNAAGAGREDTLEPEIGASLDDNYALLDFDPLMDDTYILETQGAGRVNVRVNAEAANAARFLPVEKVPTATFLE